MKTISLTKGYFAIVDDTDFEKLNYFNWYASVSRIGAPIYAYRRKGKSKISMHREILKAAKGLEVDHIDGNGLNNSHKNLRLATRSQNTINIKTRNSKRPYRGVELKKPDRYVARITTNGKRISLYYGNSAVDAAKAYDKAALLLHGKFARLNFT